MSGSIIRSYSYGEGAPDGLYTGLRAETQQTYDEANKKNGTQWEASRRVTGVTSGQKLYSIIKTGAMPIDLKSRELGFTGKGVIGRIYVGFTPVILPVADPVYNMRKGRQAVRDFELYAITTPHASWATLSASNTLRVGADIFLEGNTTNQGEGSPSKPVGSNRILDLPNTEYLLEIESLDTQNITARLEMYNGWLDLPRPA
ncbi:virion-associated protein [Shewanella phage vB_SspS_KASIA]|nr:virion-associated protein [Shewanella phage vB_SspS_KASIA]